MKNKKGKVAIDFVVKIILWLAVAALLGMGIFYLMRNWGI
jgi:hypothetical protein